MYRDHEEVCLVLRQRERGSRVERPPQTRDNEEEVGSRPGRGVADGRGTNLWVWLWAWLRTCENEVRETSQPTLCSIHGLASGISFPPISYLHRVTYDTAKSAVLVC